MISLLLIGAGAAEYDGTLVSIMMLMA